MAIIQGNFPYRIPYQIRNRGGLFGSFFAKVIVSADTTLVVDTNDDQFYNLLLNDSADADTDLAIPAFIFPAGTMIEDVGFERFQALTAAANFVLGDTVTPGGWIDTTLWATASGTDAIGVINWAAESIPSRYFLNAGSDAAPLLSTTILPAYFNLGPRVVYGDSAFTTNVIVGLDSDDEPRPHEYSMNISNDSGAVAVTGGFSLYVKYNLSAFQIREPSSDLGDTGD